MMTLTMDLFVDPMPYGGFRAKWFKFGAKRYASKKCATAGEAAALAREATRPD